MIVTSEQMISDCVKTGFAEFWYAAQPITKQLMPDFFIEYHQQVINVISELDESISRDKDAVMSICKSFSILFADRFMTHTTHYLPDSCELLKEVISNMKSGQARTDMWLSDHVSLNMTVTDLTSEFVQTISEYIDPVKRNIFTSALIESNLALFDTLFNTAYLPPQQVSSKTISKILIRFHVGLIELLSNNNQKQHVYKLMYDYRTATESKFRGVNV
ncbi:hypothetical protein [Photobacterium leiognathi]|uniref:hypothetical protein n=1 Tax=Photobacterium leiognathi TaxID=553611 RepID=UPI0029815EDF|nr:hypothetical protein [Photobacterium leiognathi]